MTQTLNPYLSFGGDARSALEFYQAVFGGDLHVNTYGSFGQGEGAAADRIMHGQLTTPSGFTLMGADSPPGQSVPTASRITISLSGDDGNALRTYFKDLSEGGRVTMPMEVQAWGDEFGMCTDRFGIDWMVNIAQPQQ
jgi:PhnB protein